MAGCHPEQAHPLPDGCGIARAETRLDHHRRGDLCAIGPVAHKAAAHAAPLVACKRRDRVGRDPHVGRQRHADAGLGLGAAPHRRDALVDLDGQAHADVHGKRLGLYVRAGPGIDIECLHVRQVDAVANDSEAGLGMLGRGRDAADGDQPDAAAVGLGGNLSITLLATVVRNAAHADTQRAGLGRDLAAGTDIGGHRRGVFRGSGPGRSTAADGERYRRGDASRRERVAGAGLDDHVASPRGDRAAAHLRGHGAVHGRLGRRPADRRTEVGNRSGTDADRGRDRVGVARPQADRRPGDSARDNLGGHGVGHGRDRPRVGHGDCGGSKGRARECHGGGDGDRQRFHRGGRLGGNRDRPAPLGGDRRGRLAARADPRGDGVSERIGSQHHACREADTGCRTEGDRQAAGPGSRCEGGRVGGANRHRPAAAVTRSRGDSGRDDLRRCRGLEFDRGCRP